MSAPKLDDRLTGAAGATPTWRPFTADAMQVVHRRAVRRQRAERLLSVTCGLLAVAMATTTFAALRSDGEGDGDARTVRTADDPARPSEEDAPVVDPSAVTTSTTRPSLQVDGRNPRRAVYGRVGVSDSDVTLPPLSTPTTGPTPSTTAPPAIESRPPAAFAALNGVEVQALQGGSCWQRDGEEVCEEPRRDWLYDAPLVDAVPSGSMWFRWDIGEQPSDVIVTSYFPSPAAEPDTTSLRCEGGNPCRIDFGVGLLGTDPTWIVVESHWKLGKVTHAVKVRTHPVEP